MGRLLNEQEIIEKNVRKMIERSSSEYTRFLETTPNFVTYFQRNIIDSTSDLGLENVEKDLGRDSPIFYNKIENLPLYGLENISLSLNREDIGLNTNYESEAVLIPNTIKPYPDDFFYIEYIGEYYLFKVSGVTNDAIKSKPFYRIEFYFFKKVDSIDMVEEQITNEYTVIFNNIGTEEKAVIEKSVYLRLEYLNNIYERLQNIFLKGFYDPQMNIITYKIDDKLVYNRHLNKFLMKYELLKPKTEYMNTIFLVDVLDEDIEFLETYKTTIYHALELQDTEGLGGEFAVLFPIHAKHTPFHQYGLKYNTLDFIEEEEDEISYPIFPKNFFDRIRIEQPYTDGKHHIENMVISFLLGSDEISSSSLDAINKFNFLPNIFSYIFIPFILYIFKVYESRILGKQFNNFN